MRERSNCEWISALRAGGRAEEAALADLRSLLLGAIKRFLSRRVSSEGVLRPEDLRHMAEDCAQDAVLLVHAKVEGFRGESRFTTWAYAIAIRVTLGELRRRRWQRNAIDEARLGQALPAWPIDDPGPDERLEQRQAWALLSEIIEKELTPLQRKALIAHVFEDMPMDLVAEWLGTSRNSLYKLIHDARKRLKAALLSRGVTHRDLIATFDAPRAERSCLEGSKDRLSRGVT